MVEMVTIYVMGKAYEVPKNLTIMTAMEYVGYKFIRGCGCRGGFCGGCGTVYRTPDDYRLKVGLACQTLVQEGMYLTQIPFFPAQKAIYDLDELEPTAEIVLKFYPELARCLSCNTCSRVCPQDLEVMEAMAAALRGDIARAADLTFDCIMCGLCAARCPANIIPYNVAILCRRLYGRYLSPKSKHLEERLAEIKQGKFDAEIERLIKAKEQELRTRYVELQEGVS
jgi:heterodisulfide reductase subunit C